MYGAQEAGNALEAIQPEPNAQIDNPAPDESIDGDIQIEASLEALRIAQQFIGALHEATLDNSNLDAVVVERLRNPRTNLHSITIMRSVMSSSP
jgi:hypothetical protein